MKLFIGCFFLAIVALMVFKSAATATDHPDTTSSLSMARSQLDDLLQKYTELHPEVVRLKKQIKSLEEKILLNQPKELIPNPEILTHPNIEPLPKELNQATLSTKKIRVDFKINPNKKFQTMQGFGSTVRLFDDPHFSNSFNPKTHRASAFLNKAQEDEILKLVYQDLGLSRVRPATDAGIEIKNDNNSPDITDLKKFNFSWKRNDGHIDYIKRVIPLGVHTYFLSPIKLESWMNEANPEEYVEWAFNIIKRWRNKGVELPYYSIINEPSYGRGGIWSKEYLLRVVILLGQKLKENGFKTKLVIPDDLNPAKAYIHSRYILENSEARQYIGALAYHLYGGKNAEGMAKLSQKYQIPVWMTEFSHSNRLLEWASLMHNQITTYNVSAIDYMWSFFGDWSEKRWPGNSLISILFQGNINKGYKINPNYYAMKHYSRYIRPGFKRVYASSTNKDLKISAFIKKNDTIIVILNRKDQLVDGHLSLTTNKNLPSFNAVQSWNNTYWKPISFAEKKTHEAKLSLPPRSITTIFTLPIKDI